MDSILAATPSRSFTMLLGSLPRKQPILVGIIPARAFVSRGPRVLPVAGVAAKGEPSRCVETLNVPELCGHASEYSHPPAEVGVDTVPELRGEIERLRGRPVGRANALLPSARKRLHLGRFPPLVVFAVRVRGLWLIEERLPHDPRRKRNEVWVLHERPEPAMRAGRQVCNSV